MLFAAGRGVAPTPTCQFQFDEGKGPCSDFALVCPSALAASTSCSVLPDRWFPPHFALFTELSLAAWDANVELTQVGSPLRPACWIHCTDCSRHSSTEAVQNIWRDQLRAVCIDGNDVDASWNLWSHEAEASLIRGCPAAEGQLWLALPASQVEGACLFAPGGLVVDVGVVSIILIMLTQFMSLMPVFH